jgi:hypothetical protein
MDGATQLTSAFVFGRRSRVVLGAPTLALSLRDDLQATVANKPGHRKEHVISRKTVVQGMPVDPAKPVVTAACFFVAGGPWVRPSPGIPCAL